jgi:hypothetical protein
MIPTSEELALRLFRNRWAPRWEDLPGRAACLAAVCPVVACPHVLLEYATEREPIDLARMGCRFGHGPSQVLRAARKRRPIGYGDRIAGS